MAWMRTSYGEHWKGLPLGGGLPDCKHGHAVLKSRTRNGGLRGQEERAREDATLAELRKDLEAPHVEVACQDGRPLLRHEIPYSIKEGHEVGMTATVLLRRQAVKVDVHEGDRLEAHPGLMERSRTGQDARPAANPAVVMILVRVHCEGTGDRPCVISPQVCLTAVKMP